MITFYLVRNGVWVNDFHDDSHAMAIKHMIEKHIVAIAKSQDINISVLFAYFGILNYEEDLKNRKIYEYNTNEGKSIRPTISNISMSESGGMYKPVVLIGTSSSDSVHEYWQSSVWNFYLQLTASEIEVLEKLKNIILQINLNTKAGIYTSIHGIEFVEFQTRQQQNNFIADMEHGHSKIVKPYRLFNESYMKVKADEIEKQLNDFNYKWGCVLIDDYVASPMRQLEDNTLGINSINKSELIERLLKGRVKILNKLNQKNTEDSWIQYGIKMLEAYPDADFVILDYSLEDASTDVRGIDFVSNLLKGELAYASPLGRTWIFPISTFYSSFKEELGDFLDLEDKIILAEGGDPVNRPDLFRFRMLNMLKAQTRSIESGMSEVESLIRAIHSLINNNTDDTLRKLKQFYPAFSAKMPNFSNTLDADSFLNSRSLFVSSYFSNKTGGPEIYARFILHFYNLYYHAVFSTNIDIHKIWKQTSLVRNYLGRIRSAQAGLDFFCQLDDVLKFFEITIESMNSKR